MNYSKTIIFYNVFFGYLVPYAIAPQNQVRLGISDDQKEELIALKILWDKAYGNYTDPVTYGKLSISTVNKNYSNCHTVTDGLNQQLKNNKAITLDDLDLLIFNIHINNTRTKSVIPKEIPALILKSVTHLDNLFQAINSADPTNGAKPKGTKRLKIVMLVQDATLPPPTIDMLKPEMESGSMRFDIPFTDDQVGKIAYVAVCFSNDAGDGVYSAIIPCPII